MTISIFKGNCLDLYKNIEPVPTPDVEKEVSDLQTIENTENQSILVQESKKERPTEKPELLRLMDQYMQFDQPYLNSNLSVELVAKKLGVKVPWDK